MARYCVGASMEIDWGEEEPQARWDWGLAKRVVALTLLGVGASRVGGLVGTAESWCSATISQRIMFDLREQLFDRLLRQSVGFFTRSRTGDVMSRIGNDVNAVEDV